MESAAVFRSFHHSVGTTSPLKSVLEMPSLVSMKNASFSYQCSLPFGNKLISSVNKNRRLVASCAKVSETNVSAISDGTILTDSDQKKPAEKNPPFKATFPDGFEALITEVCDETEVAELKLKVGDFEMHLKRSIEVPVAQAPVISHTPPPPPTPSKPVVESSTVPPPTPSKNTNPFINVSADKSAKLAALEASGSSAYVLVSSPTVGTFRRSRTLKGKKLPPACKEGDVIKEGQTVGFLDQFSTEFPVKSDVDGEVLKILYNDGDAVGYGDPLMAVLPSFHDINIH
nr:biotin carboxyl carrier protein of acetyl-CoA carboxylase-like isoform X1 [Ipomoea batatas]